MSYINKLIFLGNIDNVPLWVLYQYFLLISFIVVICLLTTYIDIESEIEKIQL